MQALYGQQHSRVFLWTSTHWSSAMTVCSTKGLLSPACKFSIGLTLLEHIAEIHTQDILPEAGGCQEVLREQQSPAL